MSITSDKSCGTRARLALACMSLMVKAASLDPLPCVSSTCIGAQDPYCGWDVVMNKCTSLEESLSMTQWEQSLSTCPVRPSLPCPGSGNATARSQVLLTTALPHPTAFPQSLANLGCLFETLNT